MALFVYPPTTIDKTGLATEAKQDTIITELQDIEADIEAGNADLAIIAGDTTSIDAKVSTEAKQDTIITGLTDLNSKISGDMFAIDHDYRDVDYVAAGTGIGQASTIVLKSGGAAGSTVRTISFTYTTNALGDDVVDTMDWS